MLLGESRSRADRCRVCLRDPAKFREWKVKTRPINISGVCGPPENTIRNATVELSQRRGSHPQPGPPYFKLRRRNSVLCVPVTLGQLNWLVEFNSKTTPPSSPLFPIYRRPEGFIDGWEPASIEKLARSNHRPAPFVDSRGTFPRRNFTYFSNYTFANNQNCRSTPPRRDWIRLVGVWLSSPDRFSRGSIFRTFVDL